MILAGALQFSFVSRSSRCPAFSKARNLAVFCLRTSKIKPGDRGKIATCYVSHSMGAYSQGSLGFSGSSGNLPLKSFLPWESTFRFPQKMGIMREYLQATAAFGLCLARQVELGSRITVASDLLLSDDLSDAQTRVNTLALRELHREARSGRAELVRLRKIVQRKRRDAR